MSFADFLNSYTEVLPLVETNNERRQRPILFKYRSVEFNHDRKKAKRKTFLSKTMRAFSHWALEIGDYSYDLKVAERRKCRYVVSQIPGVEGDRAFEFDIRPLSYSHGRWIKTKASKEEKTVQVGVTNMSDAEINDRAYIIMHDMNLRGGFHKFHNNCQIFSEEVAKLIDPASTAFNKVTNASKTMKRIDTVARTAAYCFKDALNEFRVKEVPKRLEHFFDDESYEETDAARVFLEAVAKIGAGAELIDNTDWRWKACRLEQPQFLAPQFEKVGIYNFSDEKTIADWKLSMMYSNNGVAGTGFISRQDSRTTLKPANWPVTATDWQDSRTCLRPEKSPLIIDVSSAIEVGTVTLVGDRLTTHSPSPPPLRLAYNKEFMV